MEHFTRVHPDDMAYQCKLKVEAQRRALETSAVASEEILEQIAA
jgi:hypothetical protein